MSKNSMILSKANWQKRAVYAFPLKSNITEFGNIKNESGSHWFVLSVSERKEKVRQKQTHLKSFENIPGIATNASALIYRLILCPMKKRILTWIQATSDQLHIGNYFGAIRPMLQLAEQFPDAEIFLFLAVMHSFTMLHDWAKLRQNSINVLKLFVACGVDLNRFIIYNPADIPGHVQLWRVLTCLTHMWFMERMHTYKEALDKWTAKEMWVGSFCYPILMAADILLYDADIVPVGRDQKQHVEYARDIALKFNAAYGDTFKVPEPYINPEVPTILGIDGRKMSKSYNNYIWLLDDEKTVLKRVKQISTATLTVEEVKDPDQCNVYNLCKLFLIPDEDKALRKRYQAGWLSYKDAKDYLFEKIMWLTKPIQEKYAAITDKEILDLLDKNAKIVNELAKKKITEVYKKVGFTLKN